MTASFAYKHRNFFDVLQLLLSSWRRSIIPGICGIVAGTLYRLNVFYIRQAKVGMTFVSMRFCAPLSCGFNELQKFGQGKANA